VGAVWDAVARAIESVHVLQNERGAQGSAHCGSARRAAGGHTGSSMGVHWRSSTPCSCTCRSRCSCLTWLNMATPLPRRVTREGRADVLPAELEVAPPRAFNVPARTDAGTALRRRAAPAAGSHTRSGCVHTCTPYSVRRVGSEDERMYASRSPLWAPKWEFRE